jgi:response regulator RpfG family c-di-GMP phosphodiesterase
MTDRHPILLLDDEQNVLRACNRTLRKLDVEIVIAESPHDALELVRQRKFAVVISDQRMPEMEGTQFLAQVREISPQTVRMLLTGYADLGAAVDAINQGAVYRFLTKPWDDDQLRHEVVLATEHYQLIVQNAELTEMMSARNEELRRLNEDLEARVEERAREVVKLNIELEQSLLGSINVMAQLAELHCSAIGHHSQRVAELAIGIADELRIEGWFRTEICIAATLHDIGKVGMNPKIIGIPDDQLTAAEKKSLQQHAMRGEQIISTVPNLSGAAMMIRSHHERYDGRGYPDGLAGDGIPLGSRIITLANAYDHLLNAPDSYQFSSSHAVLERLRQDSGARFDPMVFAALERSLLGPGELDARDVEIDVRPSNLQPGMVLSRDLVASNGLLILAKGTLINSEYAERVQRYATIHHFRDGIYVYRRSAPSESAVPVA